MSSIKKLLSQMATDQVPHDSEPSEVSSKPSRLDHRSPQQGMGKIPNAPRPKTQRKQSQKGG